MQLWLWMGFLLLVGVMVTLDLGVLTRRSHAIGVRESLVRTCIWITLALSFNVVVYFAYSGHWLGLGTAGSGGDLSGADAALQFFTGYLVEYSLSVDNIFVIAMIITCFRVPAESQHRLLVWGVTGAVVLRGLMIGVGALLLATFEWVIYVFGLLLLASAAKMLVVRHDNINPDNNLAVRAARRLFRVSSGFDGQRFFTRIDGQLAATPLFLAMLLVETSDVMFAIDSIPAIFVITRDPFLVFTSNVFAILGLRSLYFALAHMMDRFRYMEVSLVFLLAFIGVKMLLSHYYPIPNVVSLAIIAGILSVGVAASLFATHKDTAKLQSTLTQPTEGESTALDESPDLSVISE